MLKFYLWQTSFLMPMTSSMLLLITLLLSIVALFWDSFSAMAAVWSNSENFSHGWLIAPISLWLIWQHRSALRGLEWKYSVWGLFALGICALLWLAGELARVSAVKSVAVVLMLPSAVLLLAGWQVFKSIQFPLLFLLTMVPAGEGLTPILMEHTSSVLVWAVQATGIPIFREGMHFTLPTGQWSVVEACSGLRYVIAATILALLFVYLNFSSWKKKILFMVACLLLSVVANWLRAYMIVMVGHLSHMRYGVGDDHVIYGWVFFGLVMALIFWVGSKFGDKIADPNNHLNSRQAAMPPIFAVKRAGLVLFVGSVIFLGATTSAPRLLRNFEAKPDALSALKSALSAQTIGSFPVSTAFIKPIAIMNGVLPDKTAIEVTYFAQQDKSQDMLAYGQRLLPEVSASFVEIEKGKASSVRLDYGSATQHVVRIGNDQYMLLHWYVVGHSSVGSAYAAKAVRLFNMVSFQGDHSFSVVLAKKLQGAQNEIVSAWSEDVEKINLAFKDLSLK
jgi:exosortase A